MTPIESWVFSSITVLGNLRFIVYLCGLSPQAVRNFVPVPDPSSSSYLPRKSQDNACIITIICMPNDLNSSNHKGIDRVVHKR